MSDIDEGEIRAATVAYSVALEEERAFMSYNVYGLDAVALAQHRADFAVAQAKTQRAWVALRKAQGFVA